MGFPPSIAGKAFSAGILPRVLSCAPSILMGDVVEPRRQFIEENALEVKNLDI